MAAEEKKSSNPKIKVVYFAVGVEPLGMKTSIAESPKHDIEATSIGAKMTNKEGKIVLVPWANIKGCELKPDGK